ncbi:MAG: aldose 1-epimerase family protein [Clostridiales bacterium]|nr:aldose 1-epimerase family protein [Clostridiales bacterium]
MIKNKEYYLERIGHTDQIVYARRSVLSEGKADGLRIINIDNGGALTCTILEGRCLDISKLSYKGINLSFLGKPGLQHSTQTSVSPGEFTRYFHGGMLYTCGLRNVGPNDTDESGKYPYHGRLGMTPAKEVSSVVNWNEKNIIIKGKVELSALFGYNLVLHRQIEIPLFGNEIIITDKVENQGFSDESIMLLYHVNFGWPMLSNQTKLEINSKKVEPRDSIAQSGIKTWNTFENPINNYQEQVFYHDPICEEDQFAHVYVINKQLGLQVDVSYDKKALPQLIEWKSMASGDYALGVEPSTSKVSGRLSEKDNNRVVKLKVGEEKTFTLKLKITSI